MRITARPERTSFSSDPSTTDLVAEDNLAAIAYRSLASPRCSDTDLFYLLAQARNRNLRSGLSGILIYDRGYFFQWLEGPEDRLATVWASIKADARHRDLEVLTDEKIRSRRFTGWTLRFGHRDPQHARIVHGFVVAEDHLLERLHLDVGQIPHILSSFGPAPEIVDPAL